MSKLFISLLFLLLILYTIFILILAYKEWIEKDKVKRENIELENEICYKIIEINKLKREIANLKKSLYNDDKEDKRKWKK